MAVSLLCYNNKQLLIHNQTAFETTRNYIDHIRYNLLDFFSPQSAYYGAKLWVENCQRCHNTPSPTSFSHEQWVTVGMHMQTRAQLTEKEMDKIIKFLSQ